MPSKDQTMFERNVRDKKEQKERKERKIRDITHLLALTFDAPFCHGRI